MADLSFTDAALMNWFPPKSKLLEVYATNVSSITINPRIGYRHKLIHVAINGTNLTPTSLTREALDVILGPKTLVRYPVWLWGDDAQTINYVAWVVTAGGLPWSYAMFANKGILDMLPDAAADEPLTLSVVSGTSYNVIEALYLEYPSGDAMSHDVPGGSDYYKKYFYAWFYLMSTTVGSGQELSEYGEPFGMSLLGENGTIPPNKAFHQISLETGYQNAYQNSSISNYTVYNALHEWKNDEELFTPDTHAGLYINQQSSGNSTDTTLCEQRALKRYIDFNSNDRLKLYADVTSVTGSGSPLWVVIDGILEDLSKKPAGAGAPA